MCEEKNEGYIKKVLVENQFNLKKQNKKTQKDIRISNILPELILHSTFSQLFSKERCSQGSLGQVHRISFQIWLHKLI